MGYYVNPRNESKEDFLKRVGKMVSGITWESIPAGKVPVVLADNGMFTAAGIAYSKDELNAFTRPDDRRFKVFFLVPVAEILSVANDEELAGELKKSGLI